MSKVMQMSRLKPAICFTLKYTYIFKIYILLKQQFMWPRRLKMFTSELNLAQFYIWICFDLQICQIKAYWIQKLADKVIKLKQTAYTLVVSWKGKLLGVPPNPYIGCESSLVCSSFPSRTEQPHWAAPAYSALLSSQQFTESFRLLELIFAKHAVTKVLTTWKKKKKKKVAKEWK